ncbi:MAG TPA: Ig-like domain-containing protein [Gemmatimonadaceae bacterium]|nr:Ig-like domain-containing protein [Gemmatimonadaceae bacterium]
MRRLIALVLVAGCASASAPPGGAERHTPPEIVAVSVDSGQTNVNVKAVEFRFDEVVSDRPTGSGTGLDQIFLVSPRVGSPEVSWHRSRITVRPRKGFRPNTAYRITMLPGLVDLRGNARKDTHTLIFSTGATFPPYSVLGRVFDWAAQRPAVGAYLEAVSHPDTTIVYVTATDSLGQYDLGPLPQGTYLVRALIDQNSNHTLDRNEKWDTLTVPVVNVTPTVELDAIERDTTPAFFEGILPLDSVTLRVTFDKPLDPLVTLQPSFFRLQRADSSAVEITKVQWQAAYDQARQAQVTDSLRRADTTKAKAPAAPTSDVPTPGGPRAAPPPPKPKSPPPDRGIILTLAPASAMHPTQHYNLSAHGLRNLLGKTRDLTRPFTVAKPEPKDTTTKRPPADSAKRVPPPARPPR